MITKREIMCRIADLEFDLLCIKDDIDEIKHQIKDNLTKSKKTTKKVTKR